MDIRFYLIFIYKHWPMHVIFSGWEFAHLLIRSNCSDEMSDRERFAQIDQDKWATVSQSLRLLMSKMWPWAIPSGRSW